MINDKIKFRIKKLHHRPTPRAGGLGIFLGLVTAGLVLTVKNVVYLNYFWLFVVSSFPAFVGGLLEDITKKVSVKIRFVFMIFSGILAVLFLEAVVVRVDIPFVDQIFSFYPFAVTFCFWGKYIHFFCY